MIVIGSSKLVENLIDIGRCGAVLGSFIVCRLLPHEILVTGDGVDSQILYRPNIWTPLIHSIEAVLRLFGRSIVALVLQNKGGNVLVVAFVFAAFCSALILLNLQRQLKLFQDGRVQITNRSRFC